MTQLFRPEIPIFMRKMSFSQNPGTNLKVPGSRAGHSFMRISQPLFVVNEF